MVWQGFAANPMESMKDARSGLIPTAFGAFGKMKPGVSRGQFLRAGLGRSVKAGWEMSFKGAMIFNLPMAGFAAGSAERGHKVSAGVEALSTGVGSMIGGMLGGMPGAIVGGLLGDMVISSKIGKGVQFVHDLDRVHHRLNMGGNYGDTQDSWTMRQQASREMAGSLQNARQWLGREGVMFHS
jgi:hypothetical protein